MTSFGGVTKSIMSRKPGVAGEVGYLDVIRGRETETLA
jgi:hypothetical protein